MANFKVFKEISALPAILEANSFYYVRVGSGVVTYATDATGTIAYTVSKSLGGNFTITLPSATKEFEGAVSTIGTLPGDFLVLGYNSNLTDYDENTPDLLDSFDYTLVAGVDASTLELNFSEYTSGPLNFSWKAL